MSRHPPIIHRDDHTIRGPRFCSFRALVLRKEREDRLAAAGHILEWADIVGDLGRLSKTEAEQDGKRYVLRNTAPTAPAPSCACSALPCRHWSAARNRRPPRHNLKTPLKTPSL
jgi:hypothetical protein